MTKNDKKRILVLKLMAIILIMPLLTFSAFVMTEQQTWIASLSVIIFTIFVVVTYNVVIDCFLRINKRNES